MRKLLVLLALMAGTVGSQAADKNAVLRLKGNLEGLGNTVILTMMENQRQGKTDTLKAKNGAFDCKLELKQPVTLYIRGERGATPRRSPSIRIIGMPGETLQLKGTMTDYTVSGSQFYKQYAEVQAVIKGASNGPDTDRGAMQGARSKAIIDFAKTHPGYEPLAAFLENVNPHQWDDFLAMLNPEVRDGRMKAYYKPTYDAIKAQMERQQRAAKLQAPGIEVADFTLPDINGNPLKLSSLRGKYVVLDFWGSWCGWCIKGFPEMKKYYEKYKGKLEILGIDCNDTPEKWKKAVADHQLPWLHVYNKKGEGDVTQQFGITGYPTKIIIDPQGRIARSIIGESPAFYTYLDDLFAQ